MGGVLKGLLSLVLQCKTDVYKSLPMTWRASFARPLGVASRVASGRWYTGGRGLHSSTSQLNLSRNLSRFWHKNTS